MKNTKGCSGNHPDYEPYLEAIGAAKERDDVFAASCYCPIHNLENADAAYEWLFCGENHYCGVRCVKTEQGLRWVPQDGDMTEKQIALSEELKRLFPAYLNSLKHTLKESILPHFLRSIAKYRGKLQTQRLLR